MATQRWALYVCDGCGLATMRPDMSGGRELGACPVVRDLGAEGFPAFEPCRGTVRVAGCVVVWPLLREWEEGQG